VKEITNFQEQKKFHKRPVIVHQKAEEGEGGEDHRIHYTPEELEAA